MFRKVLWLNLILGIVFLLSMGGYDYCYGQDWIQSTKGTETLPFEFRMGKSYTPLEDKLLDTANFRFRTQIISNRTGISLGVGQGVYLLGISYELMPKYLDITIGLAAKEDIDKVKINWNVGVSLDSKILIEMTKYLGGLL